jgi:O-antigen/teichoic acid export membrane protein
MTLHFEKAIVCKVIASASTVATGICSLRVFRNYLTPDIYGAVLIALQVVNYMRFLDAGFRTVINRRLLAERETARKRELAHFGQVLYSWLAIGLLIAGVLFMALYSLTPGARSAGQSVAFYLLLGTAGALTVICSAQMSLLVGLQAQAQLFLLSASYSWIVLVALWGALRAGTGVFAFPVSFLAGTAFVYPVTLWVTARLAPGIRFFAFECDPRFWEQLGALKADAWSCLRSQVSMTLLFTLDVIIAGAVCGPVAAAVYGILTRLFSVVVAFLQASSEAAWPYVAQRATGKLDFVHALLRVNAWVYSGVLGAMFVTLNPFLEWFMGESWIASNRVFALVAFRFLIAGLAAPANFALWGMGAFATMARCLERELFAGCLLSIILGMRFGLAGVAGGFLLGTGFGTLLPVFREFSRITQTGLLETLVPIWARACVGGAAGYLSASTLIRLFGAKDLGHVYVGLIAAMVPIALGGMTACLRIRLQSTGRPAEMSLRNIARNM